MSGRRRVRSVGVQPVAEFGQDSPGAEHHLDVVTLGGLFQRGLGRLARPPKEPRRLLAHREAIVAELFDGLVDLVGRGRVTGPGEKEKRRQEEA